MKVVVSDTLYYIIIDDDVDNGGDPNPFLIDLTGLNESDEDGDAM